MATILPLSQWYNYPSTGTDIKLQFNNNDHESDRFVTVEIILFSFIETYEEKTPLIFSHCSFPVAPLPAPHTPTRSHIPACPHAPTLPVPAPLLLARCCIFLHALNISLSIIHNIHPPVFRLDKS